MRRRFEVGRVAFAAPYVQDLTDAEAERLGGRAVARGVSGPKDCFLAMDVS